MYRNIMGLPRVLPSSPGSIVAEKGPCLSKT